MEVGLLDTLSVVSLWVGKTKETLLEERTDKRVSLGNHFEEHSISYSFSFQKENAMCCRPWVSDTPAIPSSPQRYALDLECSWEKSIVDSVSTLHIRLSMG